MKVSINTLTACILTGFRTSSETSLTQTSVSSSMGINKSGYWKIESGSSTISISNLYAALDVLGIPITTFSKTLEDAVVYMATQDIEVVHGAVPAQDDVLFQGMKLYKTLHRSNLLDSYLDSPLYIKATVLIKLFYKGGV